MKSIYTIVSNPWFRKYQHVITIGSYIFLLYFLVSRLYYGHREYDQIKNQADKFSGLKTNIDQQKRKILDLSLKLGLRNDSTQNNQNSLLNVIALYCKEFDLSIVDVPRPEYQKINNVETELNQFTIEGRYLPLLKFLKFCEDSISAGEVVSVKFSTKDFQSQQKRLSLKVYFKSVKFASHDL